jgi:hypothetical protein
MHRDGPAATLYQNHHTENHREEGQKTQQERRADHLSETNLLANPLTLDFEVMVQLEIVSVH